MTIVAIGECMIELRTGRQPFAPATLAWGGDVFNTALYSARLGANVRFLSALGGDEFSHAMRAGWTDEGIDTSLVLTAPDRIPGLYSVHVDASGERHFHYWRTQSAARALFACPGIEAALAEAAGARCLYLSAITLSLFAGADLDRLVTLARSVRASGGDVVLDTNYRPTGWASPDDARAAILHVAPVVSIAMPTLDDETALMGDRDAATVAARWHDWGAREVIVKMGAGGAQVSLADEALVLIPTRPVRPLDTTGAGDAFNAAYLASRLRGASPALAATAGHRLAAAVIGAPGAILDCAAMPDLPGISAD